MLFLQTLRAFLGAVKVHNFYLNLVCKVKLIQYLQGLELMLTCSVSQHADPGRQLGSACSIYNSEASGSILVNDRSTWSIACMEKEGQQMQKSRGL